MALNFLGGDDLILGEVLEVCDVLTVGLGLSRTADVRFCSVSFAEVPVALADQGADASLPGDEAYARNETWCTVEEEDRGTDNE